MRKFVFANLIVETLGLAAFASASLTFANAYADGMHRDQR